MNRNGKITRREMLIRLSGGLAAVVGLPLIGRFGIRRSNRRLEEQIEEIRKIRKIPVPLAGLMDLKGVIHAHTFVSHDSQGRPEELINAARQAGLQFLMTTDHNSRRIFTDGFHGRFDNLLVIRGAEIGKESDRFGNQYLLAINIKEFIDGHSMGLQQIVDEIHNQGGLAFVAHPWRFKEWDVKGIDGMEVYDIADSAYAQAWKAPWMALQVLTSWDDYPEEVFVHLLSRPGYSLEKWDKLTQTRKLVGIAGNDAHQNLKIFGRQLDPYPLDFKFVQTHVLAPALEEQALLQALKAGHAYISFGILADATGFQFFAMKDRLVGIMGDEMPYLPGLVLTAQALQNGLIALYRNGQLLQEAVSTRLDHAVQEKGVYRVEVYLQVGKNRFPWILSNPIYVV